MTKIGHSPKDVKENSQEFSHWQQAQRTLIGCVLEASGGNVRKSAKALGLSRQALLRKMAKLRIKNTFRLAQGVKEGRMKLPTTNEPT